MPHCASYFHPTGGCISLGPRACRTRPLHVYTLALYGRESDPFHWVSQYMGPSQSPNSIFALMGIFASGGGGAGGGGGGTGDRQVFLITAHLRLEGLG